MNDGQKVAQVDVEALGRVLGLQDGDPYPTAADVVSAFRAAVAAEREACVAAVTALRGSDDVGGCSFPGDAWDEALDRAERAIRARGGQ